MKREPREKEKAVLMMLDSGAYTAWSKGWNIDLDKYMQFIRQKQRYIDTYFNLDVIPGKPGVNRSPDEVEEAAAASFKNYRRMLKAGLKPIPVFHQGERFKWLEKILDTGCDYVALGGLGGQSDVESKLWLDRSFTRLTNDQGKPLIRTHGLGVGSFELIKRYPWYTCDATSWALSAAYGRIFMPRYSAGKPDFSANPTAIVVSKAERGTMPPDHYLRFGPLLRERVHDFLKNYVGTTADIVGEDYIERARAIVYFYLRFQDAIGEVTFQHRSRGLLE